MKKLQTEILPPDEDAWQEALQGVAKLPDVPLPPEAPLIIDEVKGSINYGSVYQGNTLSPLAPGDTAGIDRRTADKFLHGEFPIQRRLDLHGLKEKEAFTAVEDFVKSAYQQQLRCVLIVTGKGIHRESDDWFESRGVLKDLVPQWLNTPQLRPLVLAFAYAQPRDGGDGALYLLLRRVRGRP